MTISPPNPKKSKPDDFGTIAKAVIACDESVFDLHNRYVKLSSAFINDREERVNHNASEIEILDAHKEVREEWTLPDLEMIEKILTTWTGCSTANLYSVTQAEEFPLLLVFKKGNTKAYVYAERTAIDGAEPKLTLGYMEGNKILHASNYLWCTMVIGDLRAFTRRVKTSLELDNEFVLQERFYVKKEDV